MNHEFTVLDGAKGWSFSIGLFGIGVPNIKDVVFNPPRTIINWSDGTKTVVNCHKDEFREEYGFAMAVLKKLYGGRNPYLDHIERAHRPQETAKLKAEKIAKKSK